MCASWMCGLFSYTHLDVYKRQDYLCCAGHKGLYGPMGTGLLITKQGEKLRSLIQGGTGTQAMNLEQPRDMPEYLESGTQNVPGILALGAGMDFVQANGVERIHRQELRHVQRLYDGLSRMPHVELYTPRPEERYFAPVPVSYTHLDVYKRQSQFFLL